MRRTKKRKPTKQVVAEALADVRYAEALARLPPCTHTMVWALAPGVAWCARCGAICVDETVWSSPHPNYRDTPSWIRDKNERLDRAVRALERAEGRRANAAITPDELRELGNRMSASGVAVHAADYPAFSVTLRIDKEEDRIARAKANEERALEEARLRADANRGNAASSLLRRAVGVITDMDRARLEVAAVLDGYAKLSG